MVPVSRIQRLPGLAEPVVDRDILGQVQTFADSTGNATLERALSRAYLTI